ncbi:UDP-N-acetylglucosamine 2-epimerase [Afifella marina]|nr:UDP-N-acetylglucosamine 2-epimerase [Afifella marina]
MKILIPIGTLAEEVKLIDVILYLERYNINPIICRTSQGKFRLAEELSRFDLIDYSDNKYEIGILTAARRLVGQVSAAARQSGSAAIACVGDTTTAWSAAISAQEEGIPLFHIEAGMRAPSITSPFPEEMFRRSIDLLSTFHIAFDKVDLMNLWREGCLRDDCAILTNSTVYDDMLRRQTWSPIKEHAVVHVHRRETPLSALICLINTLREKIIGNYVDDIYVVNNRRYACAEEKLKKIKDIILINPIERHKFLRLIASSRFVVSDSGTLQEECAAFSVPHLVFRNETERPYLLSHNAPAWLIGHDPAASLPIIRGVARYAREQIGVRKLRQEWAGGSEKIANFIFKKISSVGR